MKDAEHLLLTPGPVRVPSYVMDAISRPALHQRTPEFEKFWQGMQPRMQYLFQTSGPVLLLPGSGTTGMEITMRSLFAPGDQVAIQNTGKFSARWVEYGRRMGLQVVEVASPWRKTVDPAMVRSVSEAHPNLKGWVLTHVETSTSMAIDLEEIAFYIKEQNPQQLIAVDAICSAGIQALYQDDWRLDAVVTASQKGLANPAGCNLVGLSKLAIASLTPSDKHDALHLAAFLEYLQKGSYPFTPPVQLMYGVDAALRHLEEEGLPQRWNRIHQQQRRFKTEIRKMGGRFPDPPMGAGVTLFEFPGLDNDRIRGRLQSEHGIVVANGQDQLQGRVMRVGHFGDVGMAEMERLLAALQMEITQQKA